MESPSSRSTSSQWGGKIELTRTRLKLARWASRSAISKLVSFSLCRPTPFVRKALVGMNILASINLELPPFVPDRGTQVDRRLHNLRQHRSGTQRNFHHFDLGLPAVLAAHDEHVFRRVDAQPCIGGPTLARDDCRAPLTPLALDRTEDIDRLDLGWRHLCLDRGRELRPAGTLPRWRR